MNFIARIVSTSLRISASIDFSGALNERNDLPVIENMQPVFRRMPAE